MRMNGDVFSSQKNNLFTVLDVPFGSNDTIHGLSLKYACTASALRRLNKLQKDQDLYGLPHIKVPVVKHGTMHELIQKEIIKSSTKNRLSPSPIIESLTDAQPTTPSIMTKYLKEVDDKLALLKESETGSANVSLLPAEDLIKSVERKQSRSNTVFIIVAIVCIIVIIPLLIILLILFEKL